MIETYITHLNYINVFREQRILRTITFIADDEVPEQKISNKLTATVCEIILTDPYIASRYNDRG
jgi:hypothetical protein